MCRSSILEIYHSSILKSSFDAISVGLEVELSAGMEKERKMLSILDSHRSVDRPPIRSLAFSGLHLGDDCLAD